MYNKNRIGYFSVILQKRKMNWVRVFKELKTADQNMWLLNTVFCKPATVLGMEDNGSKWGNVFVNHNRYALV